MRYIICLIAALFAIEVNAGDCQNGQCRLRPPVPKVVQATGEVVQATKNVTVGAVRVVTPPYGCRRCKNGRCYVR